MAQQEIQRTDDTTRNTEEQITKEGMKKTDDTTRNTGEQMTQQRMQENR